MIQYDITSDHFRVGWIKENALPRKAEVKDLLFSDEQVYTTVQCPLTDDPLASKTEIDRIAAGVKVSRLALMGEWSYVESGYGSSLMRGFIESENLTKLSVAQVEWLAQTEAQNIASGKETGEETPLIYVKETNYRPESGQWEVRRHITISALMPCCAITVNPGKPSLTAITRARKAEPVNTTGSKQPVDKR